MNFLAKSGDWEHTPVNAIIVFKFQDRPMATEPRLNNHLPPNWTAWLDTQSFVGKWDSVFSTAIWNGLSSQNLIVMGAGNYDEMTIDRWRRLIGHVSRLSSNYQTVSIVVDDDCRQAIGDPTHIGSALAEGWIMGAYEIPTYKSKPEPPKQTTEIIVWGQDNPQLADGLAAGKILGNATCIARDLANRPANRLLPADFIAFAKEKLGDLPVTLTVLDTADMKRLQMGALMGVAQGSINPPYVLMMRYHSNPDSPKKIGLIGKGVTFDSGGISIKPANKMEDMKGDMSGGAAVLASMWAIGTLLPKVNVIGVVPLTENMPSGSAQRPSDVVHAMNGKTIEIINTDAEGRLILADALCYAVSEGATELVDIATLTGACSVALGDVASAILGTNDEMIQKFKALGDKTGEKVWQLPLYPEYDAYLKSSVADMVNSANNRLAGTASAAMFLSHFTKGLPWVHLDIASVMDFDKTSGYHVKGMSGTGARLLTEYVMDSSD